jgi:hypothetical protein
MAKSIYLVWQTDVWVSNKSKVLAYIGEDYDDCVAQISKELKLSCEEEEELSENAQVSTKDFGIFIEEERLNHFHSQF